MAVPDPHPSSALLEHAAFVRSIARAVLWGDDGVDDVVQDTWVTAIERDEERRGALRPWLAGIARRKAMAARRRRRAIHRRDRKAARTEAAPSVADSLVRAETARGVVEAVLSLPDPYRTVLVLRYYDGLPPREIARRLGRPVETVRTQIRRALARLRGALEQKAGPGWRAWVVACLPQQATHPASILALSLGVLMMKKIVAATLAVVLVVLAGWWGARETGFLKRRSPASESAAHVEGPAESIDTTDETGVLLKGTARDGRRPVVHAPFGLVHGLVTDTTGQAVAGARIWIGSTHAPLWLARLQAGDHHTRSDDEGRFSFTPQASVNRVNATADGYAGDGDYWRGGDVPIHLVLRRTDVVVRGTLRDPDGQPVADARVVAFSPGGRQPHTWGTSDADGRYEIPFVSGRELYVRAWAPGFLRVQVRVPSLQTTSQTAVDLVMRRGYWIEGRVTNAVTGEGIRGATLTTYEGQGPPPSTDIDGHFRYLATTELGEISASADGFREQKAALVFEGGVARADLALPPLVAQAFVGVVVDVDAIPVQDARVSVPGGAWTWTDREGRFLVRVWADPEGEPVSLIAEAGDAAPAFDPSPTPGEATTLRLGPPTLLRGRVRSPDGEPAPGSWVQVRSWAAIGMPATLFQALTCARPQAVSADGTFRIGGLPPGTVEIEARPGRTENALPTQVRVVVPARDALDITLTPGRVLHGQVVDGQGRGVPFADLRLSGEQRRPSTPADAQGRFRLVGCAPGPVRLGVKAPGYRLWSRELTVVDEALEVTLVPISWVRFLLQEGAPASGSRVWVTWRRQGEKGSAGGENQVLDGMVQQEFDHRAGMLEYALRGDGWTTRPVRVEAPTGGGVVDVEVELIAVPLAPEPPEREGAGSGASPSEPPVAKGTIAGRVRGWSSDTEGPSVANATSVRARRETAGPQPELAAQVQADGSFRLEEVPAGIWLLWLSRGFRHGPSTQVVVETDRTADVDDLDALELGPSIHGVVLDDEEKPVEGLTIWARPEQFAARHGVARSDRDGAFEIRDLEEGLHYTLQSNDQRGKAEELRASPSRDVVTLHFVHNGTLRGFLTGPWGDEVPSGGRVEIRGTGPTGFQTSARIQAGGRKPYFERRLPPGEYLITAQLGDLVTASSATVIVRSGEVSPRLDLLLVPGGGVHVRLLDAQGAPQRGGLLRVPEAWSQGPLVEPRDDGTYRIRGVPPGQWTIKVRGSAGSGETTFTLATDETAEVEIVLRP